MTDRIVTILLVTLVALGGCLLFVRGSRAQEPATLCYEATDGLWPTERLIVAGLVTEATWTTVGEDPMTRCADVPGLGTPVSWDVEVCNGAGCTRGELPDGSPGPAIVWGSRARRLDVSGNGTVDLPDLGTLLRSLGDGW